MCVSQMFSNIVSGMGRVLPATLVVSFISVVILVGGKMLNSHWRTRFPIPWELVLVGKFAITVFIYFHTILLLFQTYLSEKK